ncbi:store-operated calcium entry-associated regulatory factor [Ceratobasidium sp. AG-Ba]|nr:store-operated calcium entry-associated regulatory factor [Ceratobasidium sp. AG-Ba]
MSRSDRVALASIKTLTLYADKPTRARRTAPVPQLECTGSICREYEPSAIQCTNAGGTDIDIDWKLVVWTLSPVASARQISRPRSGSAVFMCRAKAGTVLATLRTPQYKSSVGTDYTYHVLVLILIAIFLWINRASLRFLNPFASTRGGNGGSGGPTPSDGRYGSGSSRGAPPPPPYTKYPTDSSGANRNQPWSPGFWTGLGAGGLAASTYHYLTRPRYNPSYTQQPPPPTWDWERPFGGTRTSSSARPEFSAGRRRFNVDDDFGAGSSTGPGTQLGEMRRATGFGGSSVR